MTWCFVKNGLVIETTTHDPADRFPAEQVWVTCPDTVQQGWSVGSDGAFSAPAAPQATLAERLAALSAERYARQTAGVHFKAAGATVSSLAASDTNSTAMMTSSFVAAQGGHWVDGTPWKMADGSFVALTAADMQQLALTVLAYVSACYAREAQLAAALASDLTTDITAGWPANGSPST